MFAEDLDPKYADEFMISLGAISIAMEKMADRHPPEGPGNVAAALESHDGEVPVNVTDGLFAIAESLGRIASVMEKLEAGAVAGARP